MVGGEDDMVGGKMIWLGVRVIVWGEDDDGGEETGCLCFIMTMHDTAHVKCIHHVLFFCACDLQCR